MLALVELTGMGRGCAGPAIDGRGFGAVVELVPVPCALM